MGEGESRSGAVVLAAGSNIGEGQIGDEEEIAGGKGSIKAICWTIRWQGC